mmetsp:Transcript_24557/g.37099  ORF Transcript_24557/g.37099 Transcript_24557/m.37099 type:complete len:741 (-) Transcript_24557:73-2295(-)
MGTEVSTSTTRSKLTNTQKCFGVLVAVGLIAAAFSDRFDDIRIGGMNSATTSGLFSSKTKTKKESSGGGIRSRSSGGGSEKNNGNAKDCLYHLTVFDRTGLDLHLDGCFQSDADLLDKMIYLSDNGSISNPKAAGVLAIGIGEKYRETKRRRLEEDDNETKEETDNIVQLLDRVGLVADDFLAPRLEWKIMAERFEDFSDASAANSSNLTATKAGTLFVDPTIYAPKTKASDDDSNSTAATKPISYDSFVTAYHSLQDKSATTTDLMLMRTFDPTMRTFANIVRQRQFPGIEDNYVPKSCKASLKRTKGRVMVDYGGVRDFLGARTDTNNRHFWHAMHIGIPYAEVNPPVWGANYRFDKCGPTAVASIDEKYGIVNGLECGFLPIWGGSCLHDKVNADLHCLSRFGMSSLTKIVLTQNGIPEKVCEVGHEQSPMPGSNPHKVEKVPEAFSEYCPQCEAFPKIKPNISLAITPEILSDPAKPLNFEQLGEVNNLIKYIEGDTNSSSSCEYCSSEELSGAASRPCCFTQNDLTIQQAVLNGTTQERPFYVDMVSSYLTRFNRNSRRRIAAARQPREEAMFAIKNSDWKTALATGMCGTLHIRRGDNIQRCEENPGSQFCSMDLSLEDYMNKLEPFLKELGEDTRHVFVMTDDPDVANATMRAPYEKKGYVFEVISGHNQWSLLTYDDYDAFLESLYGAELCKAFVGHHISTVAMLVFRRMCIRHGVCPLADDHDGKYPKIRW